jgi:hypothetical protein
VSAALGVAYEVQWYAGPTVFTHGPAATAVVLGRVGPVALGGWLTAQYRLPVVVAPDPVGVRLDMGAFRAMAALEPVARGRVTLRVGLGGGCDVVAIEPRRTTAPGVALERDAVGVDPVARGAVQLELRLVRGLVVSATLGADVALTRVHYDYVLDGTPSAVLAPWPVRPAAMIGVASP